MQFTTVLIVLLSVASAASVQNLTPAQKAIADQNSKVLVAKLFPNGKPASKPVLQPGESKGAFACAICAWGCGDSPGGWACDCCYPNGACAGQGC